MSQRRRYVKWLILAIFASSAYGENCLYTSDHFIKALETNDEKSLAELSELAPQVVRKNTGTTVLHHAARLDRLDAAKLLLKAGADFYARDERGQLPLDIPPGESMNPTRQYLRQLNQARNEFLGAVHQKQTARVKELLVKDPTLVNARDIGDGWSALMTACYHDNSDLIDLLIKAGAPLNAVDFNDGRDAVSICSERGSDANMKRLLDAGGDVNRLSDMRYGSLPMRMSPLHIACWKGRTEIVKILLSNGASVDQRSGGYPVFTPLHFAATEGHVEIVRLLLAAGADRALIDGRRGINALQMARQGKHQAVVDLLE